MASVNRQNYFDKAFEILADEGHGGLNMAALCRALRVTTGSFYNWFRDWKDFVDQFLEYWESEQTKRLIADAESEPDPRVRLDVMRALARGVPHSAEVALRAWSNADPRAAQTQREVDALRHGLILGAIDGLVSDPETARRLADLGLSLIVGHQHVDPDAMDWSLAQFIALVSVHADVISTDAPRNSARTRTRPAGLLDSSAYGVR
jgi:AcrR family transcriptional regulator